jgi:uncharacterized protein (DUF924 family)
MPYNSPGGDATSTDWSRDVLHFWFEEVGPAGWFASSSEIDSEIHGRFTALHASLLENRDQAVVTPHSTLAAVIVLDQFSRNLFRGTAQAFAADPAARSLSRLAINRGADMTLSDAERLFLYLPFEHSEDRDDQVLAVTLISRLGNADWTRYALAHQSIIGRFGRFPHRNEALNRTSSVEEIALLREPMGSF